MTNEVLQTIKSRRTVRAYRPDAVPEELLQAVLEAGTYAPTGRGRQSPTIIAVTSEGYRQKISGAERGGAGQRLRPLLWSAGHHPRIGGRHGQYLCGGRQLRAGEYDAGRRIPGPGLRLGTQRAGDLRQRRGQGAFTAWGLPETLRGVGSIALGYPAGAIHEAAKRKDGYIVRV